MTFILRNKYWKILGTTIIVIVLGYFLNQQRLRNVRTVELFQRQSIKSVVRTIRMESGGFYSFTTIDGKLYIFSPGGSFVLSKVTAGDSVFKPAYADTLRIYSRSTYKDLRIELLQ